MPVNSPVDSMFRAGQISGAQWNKLNAQKGGNSGGKYSAQPTKMAKFEDRAGVRDQGGRHDRGHGAASRSHIDKNQRMEAGGGVDGRPSGRSHAKSAGIVRQTGGGRGPLSGGVDSGGAANAYGQPAVRGQIDAPRSQKPDFPRSARMSSKHAVGRQRKGPIPAQGGQYGGGGRDTQ